MADKLAGLPRDALIYIMTMKERRLSVGLRQVDVAKKMDVDQASVSKWESGETRPHKKYHKKLAKLYKCSVEELAQSLEAVRRAQ